MIRLENVVKSYVTGNKEVKALNEIDLRIDKGQFVVICGPSGSGKTTLLMSIAAMLRPSRGTVTVEQKDLYAMSVRERARFRAENIGFVFQMFHLVPYLNVMDNVLLAGGAAAGKDKRSRACELIEKLGLTGRNHHKPSELSAGEKQRTAIARALLNHPKIILADEPTGNLDRDNAASVLGYLSEFHRDGGTVIVATHGVEADRFAERTVYLRTGKIERDKIKG